MGKTRVGIIFGGKSAEHEVSLQSAKNILDALDKERFDVSLIGIDKRRLVRVVRGDVLRELPAFRIKRGERAMGFARKLAFAPTIVGEALLLCCQIVEPLLRGAFLTLQADERGGRVG